MISSSASFGSAAMLRLARKKGNTCRMNAHASWDQLCTALEHGPVLIRCVGDDGRRMSRIVIGIHAHVVLVKECENGLITRITPEAFVQSWSGCTDTIDAHGWMMSVE